MILPALDLPQAYRRLYRNGSILTMGAGALALSLGLTQFDPVPLVLALNALLLAPVAYGVRVGIKVFDAREMEI